MYDFSARTLIFTSACLILLVGSLRLYGEAQQSGAEPGKVWTEAEIARDCDENAIQLKTTRLGCQNIVSMEDHSVRRLELSGGKSGTINIRSANR